MGTGPYVSVDDSALKEVVHWSDSCFNSLHTEVKNRYKTRTHICYARLAVLLLYSGSEAALLRTSQPAKLGLPQTKDKTAIPSLSTTERTGCR